jgi:HupE / UreJ protein
MISLFKCCTCLLAAVLRLIALSTACLMFASTAWAHKASDAYLQLSSSANSTQVQWQLSVALRDIDAVMDTLDVDNNRSLEWGEIKQNLPAIKSLIASHLLTRCGDQSLLLDWTFESLEQRSDGAYVRWAATSVCGQGAISFQYNFLKNVDATHRLLVAGMLQGQAVAAVVSPQNKPLLTLTAATHGAGANTAGDTKATLSAGVAAFVQFFPEGVHHLATGYDHLAFLLALLLPIVLRTSKAEKSQKQSQLAHRPGIADLVRTVTGFTIGHSITLVLASLGWIASPSWVEPAIAVSIFISAGLNLYPQRWLRGDVLALGFGLIHGLGFSNIMREANISSDLLPWALAGFNLGVEAGQLAGVVLWCGIHLVLVRWHRYEQVIVRGGSIALCVLALYWAVQRLAGS